MNLSRFVLFKFIIAFYLLLLPLTLLASTKLMTSQIHSIDYSLTEGGTHLMFLSTGEVVFFEGDTRKWKRLFRKKLKKTNRVHLNLDTKNNLQQLSFLEEDLPSSISFKSNSTFLDELETFIPTVLTESSKVEYVFKRMRKDYQKNSQCYNRAHIWAYEEFLRSGLKSKKYFLFFTRSYIRKYRYKWWFHVAPAVSLAGVGDLILDRRFTKNYTPIKNWTDKFIYSKRTCPLVSLYRDYYYHQEKQDCYLISVPMYYWQPRDIKLRDETGREKTSFLDHDVSHSYREAF